MGPKIESEFANISNVSCSVNQTLPYQQEHVTHDKTGVLRTVSIERA